MSKVASENISTAMGTFMKDNGQKTSIREKEYKNMRMDPLSKELLKKIKKTNGEFIPKKMGRNTGSSGKWESSNKIFNMTP